MAAESMAMLNVRLDRATKEQGDEFLAEMGVSVTEMIRALWGKLAGGDRHEARRQVESIMASGLTPERQAEIERKLAVLDGAGQSFYRFASSVGLDPATYVPLASDEDALAEARYEYLQEKWGER